VNTSLNADLTPDAKGGLPARANEVAGRMWRRERVEASERVDGGGQREVPLGEPASAAILLTKAMAAAKFLNRNVCAIDWPRSDQRGVRAITVRDAARRVDSCGQ
jgi:hypothetical protein